MRQAFPWVAGWALLAASLAMATAQPPVAFTALEIDLWPGYDRPGVLVIYRGTLAPEVALPARLALRIPASVGAPSAVAELRGDGRLISLPYDRAVDGDMATVEIIVTHPQVQLEYYDRRLESSGAERRFRFDWPGDYEVAAMTVAVQVPDLATDMVTVPEPTARAPSEDGLTYYSIVFPPLAAGQTETVSFTYLKAADELSVETMLPATPAVASPAAPGNDDVRRVVLLVGALLIAAVVTVAVVRRRRSSARPAPGDSGAVSYLRPFCTQCGAKARADDNFCHQCGNPLR